MSGTFKVSLLVSIGLVLAVPPALMAQQPVRRTITHEDVYLSRRLAAPALSPDGRWAVVAVTEPSYTEQEQATDLWLVPTDGGAAPRRLTFTRAGESGAAWSADSRRIAFSTRREGDETNQIYVLDLTTGGEAQRVTNVAAGARAPRWRPDGSAMLFTSDVYPGALTDSANRSIAADRRARRWNARVYDGFPIRDWDRWLDDRRASLFIQPLQPGAPARDLLAGTALRATPGFTGSIGSGSEQIAAVWTPDGRGVVFTGAVNRHEAAFAQVTTALFHVPVDGGEPRRLSPEGAGFGAPAFSPDGRTLWATMNPQTRFVYNTTRLVRWSWPADGSPTVVAGGAEQSIGQFEVAPDGRSVYFTSEDAGLQRLYRVAAAGGAVREVGRLQTGTLASIGVGGTGAAPVITAIWQSAVSPPEVVRVDPASGAATRLTRFNADRVADLDWQPVRHFTFTSGRGATIHNMLVIPPAFDSTRRYPLLVLMHGGPHSMWRDDFVLRWNYHLLGAPGYVVLLTNFTGSTGFGEAFAQGIQGDPLEGPALEINEAADEAIRRFGFIDASRQAAAGASYGGHLANWQAVTTTRYRALVSHAGLWDQESQYATSDVVYGREVNLGGPPWEAPPLYQSQNPIRRAANLKTPMLVTVGERDYRVPMNNAIELWTALQRQKVPSRFIVFPDENHWILRGENSRFFYAEVHAWLKRWLE